MTKQPEALRLADVLMTYQQCSDLDIDLAAAELRRLHEVNQEFLEALQRIKHHFDTDEYAWKIATVAIAKAGEQP
jgi:hypothetical protein